MGELTAYGEIAARDESDPLRRYRLHSLADPVALDNDPSKIGLYPPTLPIEVALQETPLAELKDEYHFTDEDWNALPTNPSFIADLKAAKEMLAKEGMTFRTKARLQADELLKRAWILIHSSTDVVPPSVQADMIKSVVRWAGYDNREPAAAGQGNAFNIQINLR